jgi:hypothetical protein
MGELPQLNDELNDLEIPAAMIQSNHDHPYSDLMINAVSSGASSLNVVASSKLTKEEAP